MEEKIIAYCGITCSACDAYLATQTGDPAELERVAAAWRVSFDPGITAASLVCDGCLVDSPVAGFCSVCPIRVCARERGVASCAFCDDYGCDKLTPHLEGNPQDARGARRDASDLLGPGVERWSATEQSGYPVVA